MAKQNTPKEEAPKPKEVKGVGGRPPNRPSPSAKKK
jgi:hypothetical protein